RYNGAAKAARDAVRYLSMQQQGTHKTEARNLIVYGRPDGSGTPLDPDLTAAMVPDPVWQTAGSNPLINTVTVRISGYQFRPMAASVFGFAFPTFTFGDITATMRCPI
ncbi:MAG TPA: pilus assembly protein, partial [Telluria sp.]|nr:pilus assembly protein [Telluria sp.]